MNEDAPQGGVWRVARQIGSVVLPLAVVAASLLVAVVLVFARPTAPRAEPERVAPLVEVLEVQPEARSALVTATGVTRAARQVTVIPEVSGRVVSISERLVPGGRFTRGDVLLRIDPRDYQLAVEQEAGRVRQAELDLELEEGRKRIARREWELLGGDRAEDAAPLALREPQIATVRQQLAASRSGLERARLNLERTVIRAPFDAVVVSEAVNVGQVVGQQTQVATLVGTEELWVQVSVPVEQLGVLALPAPSGAGGAAARVTQRLGGGTTQVREGRLVRLMGELDPQTRTAQLLVAVSDPFAGSLPLLPGAYVEVELEGRTLPDTYAVPRRAVHGADEVWMVGPDDTLQRRQVEVAWKTGEEVVLLSGLSAGDRVVLTPLALPLEGMPVRVVEDGVEAPLDSAAAASAEEGAEG